MTAQLAVGVMSGTSLDGVSTALVRLTDDPLEARLVAFRQDAYGAAERGQLRDAIARGGSRDLALLHVALGERFAGAVLQLLAEAKVAPREVAFVASHGQTVWHEPGRATLQLGDPAVIAERVGVRVVSDFRARDVAAGGQGAPLVPLADVLLFGHAERGRLLLNIGGMANVTYAPRLGVTDGAVAFDTGPGVAVVDAVTRRIDPSTRFDLDGERARRGKPVRQLLETLPRDHSCRSSGCSSMGKRRRRWCSRSSGFSPSSGRPATCPRPPARAARGCWAASRRRDFGPLARAARVSGAPLATRELRARAGE